MPRIGANLSDVKDEDMNYSGAWRALEDGEYRFKVTSSDYKPTKKGDGKCLHLEFQCVEPEHDRSHWREFLVLEHPNPETVRIARAKLKQLAIAVNHPNPNFVEFSEDLHGIPFIAIVQKTLADDPKYGDVDGYQNHVVGCKPLDDGEPAESPSDDEHDEQNPPPITDGDIPF